MSIGAAGRKKNKTRRIVMRELRGTPPFAGDHPVKNPKLWLAAIAAVYVLLAIAYNALIPAATPQQHQPDERGHMVYIHRIVEGRLPVFGKRFDGPEAHEPPAYYILAAPVYAATKGMGEAAATHAVRFLTTLLGLAIIVVAYMAVVDLFGDHRLALATAALVAFLPMQCDLSAAVTNDVLINLVFAVALWRLASLLIRLDRVRDPSPTPRQAIVLGFLLAAGLWTKSQAFLLAPIYVVAFALMAYRHRATAGSTITAGLAALILGVILASPWMMRNQVIYGDPLGQKAFTRAFERTTTTAKDMIGLEQVHRMQTGAAVPGQDPGLQPLLDYLALDAKWTFASFFGVFDSMTLFWGQDPRNVHSNAFAPLPAIYDVILAACLVIAGGLVRFLARRKPKLTTGQSSTLWVYVVAIAGVGYVFLMFNLTFFQAQGRYWFPVLLPLAAFSALGLRGLLPKWNHFTIAAMIVSGLLLALNIYTLAYLLPARFST